LIDILSCQWRISNNIASTQESGTATPKSSAGDKIETSREMAQIELKQLENQAGTKQPDLLNGAEANQLQKTTNNCLAMAACVTTNNGKTYFSLQFHTP